MAVIDEFMKRTGYYYCWGIESDIRLRAKTYPNSFQCGIFASCREIHRTTTHCGLFGGSEQEALIHFTRIAFAELALESEGESESTTKKDAKKVLNDNLTEKMDQMKHVDEEKEKEFVDDKDGKSEQVAKRGNTSLDEKAKQLFALCFGCSPSVGVQSDTHMMSEISNALITRYDSNLCMDIVQVIESLQGSDTNLELVQSSTMRPLRLFYVYNVVQRTLGFVFAWTHLKDIVWTGTIHGEYEGQRYPAQEMAELVKKEMMAKDALDITDVEIIVDRNKVETISVFQDILSKALKIIREENCRIGIFIVAIGLMICDQGYANSHELLTKLDAPLTDDKLMPFFHLTCAGEAVSMVQLSTWLANHPEINVALIHQYDSEMEYKAGYI